MLAGRRSTSLSVARVIATPGRLSNATRLNNRPNNRRRNNPLRRNSTTEGRAVNR